MILWKRILAYGKGSYVYIYMSFHTYIISHLIMYCKKAKHDASVKIEMNALSRCIAAIVDHTSKPPIGVPGLLHQPTDGLQVSRTWDADLAGSLDEVRPNVMCCWLVLPHLTPLGSSTWTLGNVAYTHLYTKFANFGSVLGSNQNHDRSFHIGRYHNRALGFS